MSVKVCGVTRAGDARTAAAAGADFVGAILSPGFARSVEPAAAAAFVPAGEAVLVAVVVDAGVAGASALARAAGAGVIQLHGDEPPGDLRALREEGAWRLWKAVRVRSPADVEAALERYGGVAHGLLLDGFLPGRLGGTGVPFSWETVAPLRERFPEDLALIAAGGLTPDNVGEAVRVLRPSVADVSSGVESRTGVKDPEKVRAFVARARRAARARSEGRRAGEGARS